MPPDCSKSEFELFKVLANPSKTNFDKKSAISRAVDDQLKHTSHESFEPLPPPPHDYPPSPPRSFRSVRSERSFRRDPDPDPIDHDNVGEKQALIVELNQLKSSGVVLSRDFTMDDNVGDMRFEVNRVRANSAAHDAGTMGTMGLELFLKTVESANSRWGPVLHLDGLSSTVDANRDVYKSVFSQLYKKHCKRGGGMTPELQLAMLVGGSTLATHWGHANGCGTDDINKFINNNMPESMKGVRSPPPPQPQTTPDAPGAFTQRPSMRRPSPMPQPQTDPQHVHNAEMEAMKQERAAWAQERAALRSQLHSQANTMPPPVFMYKPSSGSSPDIEILN